jgi:hypothetical protein
VAEVARTLGVDRAEMLRMLIERGLKNAAPNLTGSTYFFEDRRPQPQGGTGVGTERRGPLSAGLIVTLHEAGTIRAKWQPQEIA